MSLDRVVFRRPVAVGAQAVTGRAPIVAILLLAAALAFTILALSTDVNAQSALRSDFDHDSTSFQLDGAHIVASCGSCHRSGNFAGTLRECEDCHSQGGTATATAKPARHILTSQRCDSCHATRSFIPLQRMDHNEVHGECRSCHDNRIAQGKPVDHIPAGDQCQSCHLTVAFSPVVRFDHSGIATNCVSCHDGTKATGKPVDHLPTTNVCEDCHGTNTWLGVAFDHLQAIGSCSSCHDGVKARGKHADHIPTDLECDACHNTTAF